MAYVWLILTSFISLRLSLLLVLQLGCEDVGGSNCFFGKFSKVKQSKISLEIELFNEYIEYNHQKQSKTV